MVRRLTPHARKAFRIALWISAPLGALALAIAAFLWIGNPYAKTEGPMTVGVTFSAPYARSLGLNWRETLAAALDELRIRHFRIPVYWSLVQPSNGAFDWRETDYQLDEIAMRNGRVNLAIGQKLPRWPECWIPEWAAELPAEERQSAVLAYLEAAVLRYREHPALESWQVENEALFPFGICPAPDKEFFKKEIALVRALDPNHPIATTDSGELSTWLSVGPLVDRLGVSVYRVVVTPQGAVWRYGWIPPYWYARHAALVSRWVHSVYVSEFQMEPWAEVATDPLEKQFKTFSPGRMESNFAYADRMRISSISFWGVEWWWWMKTAHQDARFWEIAKRYFVSHGR